MKLKVWHLVTFVILVNVALFVIFGSPLWIRLVP